MRSLFGACLFALAQTTPWAFNPDNTIPLVVPEDLQAAAEALEYDDDQPIRGLIADLNRDGAGEFILQSAASLCAANCVYLIFDGRTHRHLAELTAARVHVESRRVNGYPVITALA